MKNIFAKPFTWAIFMTIALTASCVSVILDTFVIAKPGDSGEVIISDNSATESSDTSSSSESSTSEDGDSSSETDTSTEEILTPTYTSNSYVDSHMSLSISTIRRYDTTIFVAEVIVDSYQYIRAALANNTYGQNITQKVSAMATNHNAIFAVNGDYYGYSNENSGFVVRNGIGYRYSANTSNSGEALILNTSGDLSIVDENATSKSELLSMSPWQAWSFGPSLIDNGQIMVNESTEVDRSTNSNPRTGMGMVEPGHYIFIVSNGRISNEAGLTLLELANVFASFNCVNAYNLDGGGSSEMWFNGKIINTPSEGRERSVSDCVYLGYA